LPKTSQAEGIVVRTADKVILDSVSNHKMNYLFPVAYKNKQDGVDKSELIFQFSAKKMIFFKSLYVAYTQQIFWQFLDKDNSSPIREINYNPELFYDMTPEKLKMKNFGASIGFEHESNGQKTGKSRSWDRFYIWPYWRTGSSQYSFKLWARRPEDEKESPTDPKGDDNPDIHKYFGYGEFYFYHTRENKQSLSGMLRGNTATGKAAIQIDYTWPLSAENTHFVTRIFSGYGESLIDYNQSVDRVSLGFKVMGI
jgi:phospholipase A1